MKEITVKLNDIVFDETLYPRKDHDPSVVQQYAEQIEGIKAAKAFPIVSADMRLLDGKHRWLAYRTVANGDNPDVSVYQETIDDEKKMLLRAIELNSTHGYQLTPEDKKQNAIRLYEQGYTADTMAKILSVGKPSILEWTSGPRKSKQEKENNIIEDMWQRCYTAQEIADTVGQSQQKIASITIKVFENYSGKTGEFGADFKPIIGNVWRKKSLTNEVSHFGNSEQSFVDNLIYKFTAPGEIVIDPFAGGGSTLDVCRKRFRRCWIGDRKPIVAREHEIREHDLVTDEPPDLKGRWGDVKLVFLDPPYWKQAEGKYSDDKTDLANMELDSFHTELGKIVNMFARKATNAHIALMIQPTQWRAPNKEYTDHICEVRDLVKKKPINRYSAPYESQQLTPQMVNYEKENKTISLVLTREIIIWGP